MGQNTASARVRWAEYIADSDRALDDKQRAAREGGEQATAMDRAAPERETQTIAPVEIGSVEDLFGEVHPQLDCGCVDTCKGHISEPVETDDRPF